MTFSTGYIGLLKVTNSNTKFCLKKKITNADDFIPISISPGAYEIESLINEIKRFIIAEEHFTESDYPL